MMKKLLMVLPIFLFICSLVMANSVTLYPSDDTYADSTNPTTNYGTSETLRMGGGTTQALIKFNLSSCTGINYTDITLANLYTYTYSASGSENFVFNVSTSGYGWNESGLTWNNKPAITSQNIFNFYSYSPLGTEEITNITTPLKSALISGYDSLTFYLTNYYGLQIIYSKEATNSAYKPRLEITYNGTLTCNGTGGGNATTLQEAHIPSYIKPYSVLPCYAKDSVNEAVTWKIYKKELADSGFNLTFLGSGTTQAGAWARVGQLNASYVIPDALFYCEVSNAYGSVVSNNANATQYLNITYVFPPSDRQLYEEQYQSVRFRNERAENIYAYIECEWQSPTGLYYYPNDTIFLYACKNSVAGLETIMASYKNMTDTGIWNSYSCSVYASAYSDCRYEDLGLQDYTLNSSTWAVSGIPSIEDIYITPDNPLTNQSVSCFAKAISGDNATILDEVWIYFAVDITGNLGSVKFTNVTNGTYVNASYNIKDYAVSGSNVSCVAFAVQRMPVYVGGLSSTSNVIIARVLSGSVIGQSIGDLLGVAGESGDMIFAFAIILVAIVLVAVLLAYAGVNGSIIGIIAIAILLAGIVIFTIAGYLPWILLALCIVVVAVMVVGLFKNSGLSGGI